MISRFFIDRPVLANVLALVFVLIGLVALLQLPTAEYPNVVPPTIQVSTRYPGATAKTLVDTVALPIEQQVNGVEDMLYMQSTSASDGTYTLTVTFAIGTDPDKAQILVQNQVSAAIASLPLAVQSQGVTTAKKSSSISNSSLWFRLTAASTTYSCRTTPLSACRTSWLASRASAP